MKRETDGKIKNTGAKNQEWPIKATLLLTVLLTFEVFWFTSAYRHLSQSIQKERIDSIEQMSTLISEKLLLLRQNYEDKVSQAEMCIRDRGIIDRVTDYAAASSFDIPIRAEISGAGYYIFWNERLTQGIQLWKTGILQAICR